MVRPCRAGRRAGPAALTAALLAAVYARTAAARALQNCAQPEGAFSVYGFDSDSPPGFGWAPPIPNGTLRSSPCPDITISVTAVGRWRLFACHWDGAVLCDGDGSGGALDPVAPARCTRVGMVGCPGAVWQLAEASGAAALYAACDVSVSRCEWDPDSGAVSACETVLGLAAQCPGGQVMGVLSLPAEPSQLLLMCYFSGLFVCPLTAPGAVQLSGACEQRGEDPCGASAGETNRAASLTSAGLAVACGNDRNANLELCTERRLPPLPPPVPVRERGHRGAPLGADCSGLLPRRLPRVRHQASHGAAHRATHRLPAGPVGGSEPFAGDRLSHAHRISHAYWLSCSHESPHSHGCPHWNGVPDQDRFSHQNGVPH
eukprot:TRINITY_DN15423_c0_g2_i4.p1 TRINITY_DN15423_c0_g2~~TRINITY_DN15423_c0_g2_i4.p1  ORF type:complete len:398 (+),score=19.02 TRINITY_DN15423_c0_g2_i4:75-1196(+)